MRTAVRNWLLAWSFWTALALFFAISASLTYRSTGRPANWTLSIERSLTEWWLWALLTPVVVALSGRYPLLPPHRFRHATIHIAAGGVLAVINTVAEREILAWLTGFRPYLLVSTLALQFFVYGAIVATAHGAGFYARSREREQLEARLAETRLQLLSMQLQPHFLFNTLNTIAELVHDDPNAADYMITGLSDLLRRTLDLGTLQEIPLAAELDLLDRYLDIQKARFGDRLHVRVSIDPAARDASVPVLLLQPLVENAIRHGLAARVAAGQIEIEARRRDDSLVLTVTDDGPGADAGDPRERVGLGNTRARLQALYGTNYHLTLTNVETGGARLTLRVPYRVSAASS